MPEPLFILCPPRTYSSLVSSMLGQHPDCYGLPELNLFLADTLGEAWQSRPLLKRFVGRDGLLRTLAQLHEGQQTGEAVLRAAEWIDAHSDWPVRQVLDHIQGLVGDKILVEKSPIFSRQREYLERMLNVCPKCSILHLLRHPRGMGESYVNLRANYETINQVFGDASEQQYDPEKRWNETHGLIIAMTENLPPGQCMRLKGEALLADLDNYLRQICEWLDIRTDAQAINAMMHPEDSPYAHPGPPEAPRGNDPNFLANPAIDRSRLTNLKEPHLDGDLSWRPGDAFTAETRRLAKHLGYR
jgi:hypothetical protein